MDTPLLARAHPHKLDLSMLQHLSSQTRIQLGMEQLTGTLTLSEAYNQSMISIYSQAASRQNLTLGSGSPEEPMNLVPNVPYSPLNFKKETLSILISLKILLIRLLSVLSPFPSPDTVQQQISVHNRQQTSENRLYPSRKGEELKASQGTSSKKAKMQRKPAARSKKPPMNKLKNDL